MNHRAKEYAAAALAVILFLLIFGIAGTGDMQVRRAEQCWDATHQQSCATK